MHGRALDKSETTDIKGRKKKNNCELDMMEREPLMVTGVLPTGAKDSSQWGL